MLPLNAASGINCISDEEFPVVVDDRGADHAFKWRVAALRSVSINKHGITTDCQKRMSESGRAEVKVGDLISFPASWLEAFTPL